MSATIKAIPNGYHSVTPYLIIKNASKAIEFYKKALNAEEIMRFADNDRVMHAEIRIGDSPIMLADECPEMEALSPETLKGSPISIHLYVEDVDTLAKQAVAAGMKTIREVQNQFYGDRSGYFIDPFGHKWCISSHVEDVSEEEMAKRTKEIMKENKK